METIRDATRDVIQTTNQVAANIYISKKLSTVKAVDSLNCQETAISSTSWTPSIPTIELKNCRRSSGSTCVHVHVELEFVGLTEGFAADAAGARLVLGVSSTHVGVVGGV